MTTVADCTSCGDVSAYEAFDPSEELESWFEALHTANKTDSFRAVFEINLMSRIPAAKTLESLDRVACLAKVELSGSNKAWQKLQAAEAAEEAGLANEIDEEDADDFEIELPIGTVLDVWKQAAATITNVSPGAISTSLKFTASGYDANEKLLGSKSWETMLTHTRKITIRN